MSAIAIDLFGRLRESGMADEHARQIAEVFDIRVENALREAKRHTEQVSERAAEKSDAKYATKTEVEFRDQGFTRREESESQYANLRADNREMRVEIRQLHADNKESRVEIRRLHADNKESRADIRGIQKELQYLRWMVTLIAVVLVTGLVERFLS